MCDTFKLNAEKVQGDRAENKYFHRDSILVHPNAITDASWNPDSRSDTTRVDIKTLAYSMVKDGQQVPVMVGIEDNKLVLINGHRRLAAAKWIIASGIDPNFEIWAVVSNTSGISRAEAYAIANFSHQTIQGNDIIQIWLREERAVKETHRKACQRFCNKAGGRKNFSILADMGFSMNVGAVVTKLQKYLGVFGNVISFFELAKWILTVGSGEVKEMNLQRIRKAFNIKIDPAHLATIILKRAPLAEEDIDVKYAISVTVSVTNAA